MVYLGANNLGSFAYSPLDSMSYGIGEFHSPGSNSLSGFFESISRQEASLYGNQAGSSYLLGGFNLFGNTPFSTTGFGAGGLFNRSRSFLRQASMALNDFWNNRDTSFAGPIQNTSGLAAPSVDLSKMWLANPQNMPGNNYAYKPKSTGSGRTSSTASRSRGVDLGHKSKPRKASRSKARKRGQIESAVKTQVPQAIALDEVTVRVPKRSRDTAAAHEQKVVDRTIKTLVRKAKLKARGLKQPTGVQLEKLSFQNTDLSEAAWKKHEAHIKAEVGKQLQEHFELDKVIPVEIGSVEGLSGAKAAELDPEAKKAGAAPAEERPAAPKPKAEAAAGAIAAQVDPEAIVEDDPKSREPREVAAAATAALGELADLELPGSAGEVDKAELAAYTTKTKATFATMKAAYYALGAAAQDTSVKDSELAAKHAAFKKTAALHRVNLTDPLNTHADQGDLVFRKDFTDMWNERAQVYASGLPTKFFKKREEVKEAFKSFKAWDKAPLSEAHREKMYQTFTSAAKTYRDSFPEYKGYYGFNEQGETTRLAILEHRSKKIIERARARSKAPAAPLPPPAPAKPAPAKVASTSRGAFLNTDSFDDVAADEKGEVEAFHENFVEAWGKLDKAYTALRVASKDPKVSEAAFAKQLAAYKQQHTKYQKGIEAFKRLYSKHVDDAKFEDRNESLGLMETQLGRFEAAKGKQVAAQSAAQEKVAAGKRADKEKKARAAARDKANADVIAAAKAEKKQAKPKTFAEARERYMAALKRLEATDGSNREVLKLAWESYSKAFNELDDDSFNGLPEKDKFDKRMYGQSGYLKRARNAYDTRQKYEPSDDVDHSALPSGAEAQASASLDP